MPDLTKPKKGRTRKKKKNDKKERDPIVMGKSMLKNNKRPPGERGEGK